MSNEFLTGLFTGVFATTLGFVLTMIWDIWKLRRDDRLRTTSVLRAIRYELSANLKIADSNRRQFEAELPVLKDNKHFVAATVPLKQGVWEILKVNLPDRLLTHESLFSRLNDLAIAAARINEGMTSRQLYRDTSANNTAFPSNMTGRNRTLIEQVDAYAEDARAALDDLNQLV